MINKSSNAALTKVTALLLATLGASTAMAADPTAPAGRKIGYVITEYKWALYETKDAKAECPDGVNELGPREQFKAEFPADAPQRSFLETQLARESDTWWPKEKDDRFPFRVAGGKISVGVNLDGKVKPTDFTSPDGKAGIDNQMFRALGCVPNYRLGGSVENFEKIYHKKMNINRIMIELTDVDSLVNDDDVTITTYRGRDSLVTDGTGNGFVPGGTQRADLRWGKDFIHTAKAKIVDGTLTSEPLDFKMPNEVAYGEAAYYWLRDSRFELKLTPTNATGLVGGYADLETFHRSRNRKWSTHHLSYGQESSASLYRAMKRLADGFPDPTTGENTALSAGFTMQMVQVHILHKDPPKQQQVVDGGNVAPASPPSRE